MLVWNFFFLKLKQAKIFSTYMHLKKLSRSTLSFKLLINIFKEFNLQLYYLRMFDLSRSRLEDIDKIASIINLTKK